MGNEKLKDETVEVIKEALKPEFETVKKGLVSKEDLDKEIEKLKESNSKNGLENVEELKKSIDTQTAQLKQLGVDVETLKTKGVISSENEFEVKLKTALESERCKDFFSGKSKTTGVMHIGANDFVTKDVVSMGSNYTGDIIPTRQSGIVVPEININKPYVRQIIPTIIADNPEYTADQYLEVVKINRAAMSLDENGKLPTGSIAFEEKTSTVKRIGWMMDISRRLTNVLSMAMKFIMNLMPSGLRLHENFQLLYGDGNGHNVKGITKICPDESVLAEIILAPVAGSIASIESYDGGAQTKVILSTALSKMETGMKAVFTGLNTGMNVAEGIQIKKMNDTMFVVEAPYIAVADTSTATVKIISTFGSLVPMANIGDAFRIIVDYLTYAQYAPNAILVHPSTMTQMKSIKDVTGRNISNEYFTNVGGTYMLDSTTPIIPLECVKRGEAIVGDFQNGCYVIQGDGINIEIKDDVEYRSRNMYAVMIDEDIIFSVPNPYAFMNANIKNVIDAIDVANPLAANVAIISPLENGGVITVPRP